MTHKCHWLFTLNNPTNEETVADLEWIFEDQVKYAVFQLEEGDGEDGEPGTVHYQGYLELPKSQRLSYVKRMLPRAHWEPRRGTREQARDYCMKDSTRLEGPWHVGNFTSHSRGKRTDLNEMKDEVKTGMTRSEAMDKYTANMARYRHFYSDIQWAYFKTTHQPDKRVVLYCGETGTGKTRKAREENPDAYWMPINDGFWFDGYDGQPVVVLDDFAGKMSKVGLTQLLRLLHDQTEKVPVKGAFAVWKPQTVIITTNIHPEEWYDYTGRNEQYKALQRRITSIWQFSHIDGVRVGLPMTKENFFT